MHVRKFFALQVPATIGRPVGENPISPSEIPHARASSCRRLLASALTIVLLAIAPQLETQAQRARTDATSERRSLSHHLQLKSLPENEQSDNRSSASPPRGRGERTGTRFGLAFKTSTLGLGADLGVRIFRPFNLRVGFSTFHFEAGLKHDGVPYEGSLRLRSLQAVLDWFPTAGSFHMSPGLVFHNDNRVMATSTPPPGQIESAGNVIFISDPQNPITGKAKSIVGSVAPMILLGFGNLVPRTSHFGFSLDFGVLYQGHPTSTFVLVGAVCDASGTLCTNIAKDADTQKAVKTARHDLEKGVSFMRYYPVVSVEFGYRF